MKKIRLFFLIIVFFLGFQHTGFGQQLVQGFENSYFPPAGWEVRTLKGTGWVSTIDHPRSGKKSAFVDFQTINNGYLAEGDSWLIAPKIFVTGASDKLSFYMRPQFSDQMDPFAGYYDSLLIYVSTTNNDLPSFALFQKIAISGLTTVYAQYQYSLAAYAGQNIYIAFRNHQIEGSGFNLDDITAGNAINNDVGSSGINLSTDAIVSAGTSINIVDTIKNFGTTSIPAGIPVKYSVNGGPVKTVTSAASLAAGATQIVSFTGVNAFVPPTGGNYVIKVFTDLGSDNNRGNDTIKYLLTVQDPITSYPHFTDFDNDPEWTIRGDIAWQRRDGLNVINGELVNPVGQNDTAMLAPTFGQVGELFLRSPLLNFTSVAKPMLNFYVASCSAGSNANDILEILISTDGGLTYQPTPLYKKANNTAQKLSTVADQFATVYVPKSASDWRHEIVDLSSYAGMNNVMVCFKVTADNSNGVWIDNVTVVDQPVAYYHTEKVTSPNQVVNGTQPFNTIVTFHSLPAADSIRMQGHNETPPNSSYNDNFTATSPDGTISTPNYVFDRYVTIAFSGNSISRATYDISMSIAGLTGIQDADKLYILKRADQSGAWEALNTTRSGNMLTASGLQKFSDFAIGYYSVVVPVDITSFSGYLNSAHASVLIWKTAQEQNIRNFEVQRMDNGTWRSLGSVASIGGSLSNSYSFTDYNPETGVNFYRLKINGVDGNSTYSDIVKIELTPSGNKVYQNVPNPFKDYTVIRYDLSKKANVKIVVYDVTGSEIAVIVNGEKQAGSYQAKWQSNNMPSGTYFYRVMVDGQVITKNMLKL